MSTKLNALISDLEDRVNAIRHFNPQEEITCHCDDLESQVMIAVDSALKKLRDFEEQTLKAIREYKKSLLERVSETENSQQSTLQQDLAKLSKVIGDFKSQYMGDSQAAFDQAECLADEARRLRRQARSQAFKGDFLRFYDINSLSDVGYLIKSQIDTMDELILEDVVLKEKNAEVNPLEINGVNYEITALQHLQDGNIAIAFKDYGSIFIWSPNGHRELEYPFVVALTQLPNGHLVSGDIDGNVDVWNLCDKKNPYICHLGCIGDQVVDLKVSISRETVRLIALGLDINVWEISDSKYYSSKDAVVLETIRETGEYLRAVRDISCWNQLTKRPESCLTKYYRPRSLESDDKAEVDVDMQVSIEVLWNGHLAFSLMKPEGAMIQIWNLENELRKGSRPIRQQVLSEEGIQSCTFLPSGLAVMCLFNQIIQIYSLADFKMFQWFRNEPGPILAIRQPTRNTIKVYHLELIKGKQQPRPSLLQRIVFLLQWPALDINR